MAKGKRPIDLCWAEQLIGLQINVPSCWWKGYNTSNLNRSQIVQYDKKEEMWLFVCLAEPEHEYRMPYLNS